MMNQPPPSLIEVAINVMRHQQGELTPHQAEAVKFLQKNIPPDKLHLFAKLWRNEAELQVVLKDHPFS